MRKTFRITVEDKERELSVIKPTAKIGKESQLIYNKTFAEALSNGALLRAALEKHIKKQGIVDDKQDEEYRELIEEIRQYEDTLKRGGIKKSEGKSVALKLARARGKLRSILSEHSSLFANTAEGQAENARFNFLVWRCLLDEEGNNYYSSYEEFEDRGTEEVAVKAAELLGSLVYGLEENFDATLPENQFLVKYGYVNDDLRFVDPNGNPVDIDGNPVKDKEEVETQPFLDDDGNPLD